jgi:putative two-component system response regulator
MTIPSGTDFGSYRVARLLGRGGMGEVYLGLQTPLDRLVALKVLPWLLIDDPAALERFRQEAKSLARLSHPNIVRVFDFGNAQGVTYLVMEYIDGGPLSAMLGKPVPLEDVISLLAPIASALDHAHEQGLLHRDIKPSNVLLKADGTPMLTDFGLARMIGGVRDITATGTVVGTPEYMSPEQVSGEPLGSASDRYALAVIAYEMLTGRIPFDGNTPASVLISHLTKPMPPTPELFGEASAHLEEALRRGLAKDPTERYPSAVAFIQALQPAVWPRATTGDTTGLAQVAMRRQQVLVVDDSLPNRELIEACLAGVDCDIRTAAHGEQALHEIDASRPDLVLLDVQMPGMDGHEVCRRIKSTAEGRLLPVVMITGLGSVTDRVKALEAGADDFMSKPVERTELQARVRSALRLKALHDSLDNAERVINALAEAVEAKDSYTELHTQRVAAMARLIGSRLGLREEDLDDLYRGALIHDIGKIGVPDAILLKPGRLTPEEEAVMRSHTVIGERIVRPLHSGTSLLKVVRHHHERMDGDGYPDRLRGEGIPIAARIVAVCDAHDAMVSDRPYRRRLTEEKALATLRAGAGAQWDAAVVDHFLAEIGEGALSAG